MRRQFAWTLVAAGVVAVGGCGGGEEAMEQTAMDEVEEIVLGPTDGHELAPTDIDRVSIRIFHLICNLKFMIKSM